MPTAHNATKLEVYREVLRLGSFSTADLCAAGTLTRSRARPVLADLVREGILTWDSGERTGARHRPAGRYHLVPERRQDLVEETRAFAFEQPGSTAKLGLAFDTAIQLMDDAAQALVNTNRLIDWLIGKPPAANLDQIEEDLKSASSSLDLAACEANVTPGQLSAWRANTAAAPGELEQRLLGAWERWGKLNRQLAEARKRREEREAEQRAGHLFTPILARAAKSPTAWRCVLEDALASASEMPLRHAIRGSLQEIAIASGRLTQELQANLALKYGSDVHQAIEYTSRCYSRSHRPNLLLNLASLRLISNEPDQARAEWEMWRSRSAGHVLCSYVHLYRLDPQHMGQAGFTALDMALDPELSYSVVSINPDWAAGVAPVRPLFFDARYEAGWIEPALGIVSSAEPLFAGGLVREQARIPGIPRVRVASALAVTGAEPGLAWRCGLEENHLLVVHGTGRPPSRRHVERIEGILSDSGAVELVER